MILFDVLKARAGLPVDDPMAVLFAKCLAISAPESTLYRTSDNKVFADNSGKPYALMEASYGS